MKKIMAVIMFVVLGISSTFAISASEIIMNPNQYKTVVDAPNFRMYVDMNSLQYEKIKPRGHKIIVRTIEAQMKTKKIIESKVSYNYINGDDDYVIVEPSVFTIYDVDGKMIEHRKESSFFGLANVKSDERQVLVNNSDNLQEEIADNINDLWVESGDTFGDMFRMTAY